MAEPGATGTSPQPDALSRGLRTLVDDGTLAPEQAGRVEAVLRAAGVSASAGAPARQARVLVEIAGYVGGALLLAGAATIVGYLWGELSRGGRVGMSALVTVVLIGAAGAVAVLGRRASVSDAVRTRLASTLGALGTGAAVLTGLAVLEEHTKLLALGVIATLVAIPLLLLLRGTPMLFATWLGGLLTVYGVADALASENHRLWWAGDQTDLWLWGVLPACYGLGWIGLALLPRLPADFARLQNGAGLLGGLAGLFGSEYAAVDQGAAGLVLGALVVAACFAGFTWRRHWGLAASGVLCALIVPTTALQTMFDNPLAAAVGLLVIGGALLGAGLVALVRRRAASPEN